MPTHHGVWGDQRQVLTPAGTPPTRQHPEQLVPCTKPSMWSGSSWPSQNSELVTKEQVLEREVLARAQRGQDSREQQPEEFKHVCRIADFRPREVLPSDSPPP